MPPEIFRSRRMDANETIFFNRQLEYIKKKVYEKRYPQFKATQLIPVSFEAGPGANSITYDLYDQVGMAKWIANYADDLPLVSVNGQQFTATVKGFGEAYDYSLQDIRAARMANKNLAQRLANAARRANDQFIEDAAWFGDASVNIGGLLRNPNITGSAAPDNAGSTSTLWVNKTAAEILTDLNTLVDGIFTLTNGVEIADTLVLPIAQYRDISSRRVSSVSDTTVLKFFLETNKMIKNVEWLNQLASVSPAIVGGADSTDIALAYRKDPDVLTLEITLPFTQHPVQETNLSFKVNCESRTGGVIIYLPLAMAILEGI